MTELKVIGGEKQSSSFSEFDFNDSKITALRCIGSSIFTLFHTPDHYNLQHEVTAISHGLQPQPLEPTIDVTAEQVQSVLLEHANLDKKPSVSPATLIMLGSFLIQNTDLSAYRSRQMSVPFNKIENLHGAVVDQSRQTGGALGAAKQLRIALDQSEGDITEAQWRLLTTSRLHARWLDSNVVADMPQFTNDEKVTRMIEWQNSITAFKNPDIHLPQDANGDNYYMWTHAFAKFVFNLAIPEDKPHLKHSTVTAFHHGTKIMRNVAQKVRPQSVPSDHTNASKYGNLVGQVCIDALEAEL